MASIVRAALVCGLLSTSLVAQKPDVLPDALQQLVDSERAFAARAVVVGWKTAFLEYFSERAVGFQKGEVGMAREHVRSSPDPAPGAQLLWEPRVGDIAGSGELGWLTGPSRNINPARNNGRPQHAVYASVWKRQPNGSFRVVMDVGIPVPSAAPFAPGFARPAAAARFSGDYDENSPPLGNADAALNSALRSSPARAWRGLLAEGARLHRPGVLPIVGERNITRWAASQAAYTLADSRFSEVARSGDLGYTWGTYAVSRTAGTREEGFYVRVWTRQRDGQWKLALDVLQPQ